MTSTPYRWSVELVRADGTSAGRAPIEPDFGAAFEAARFAGIRLGRLPARRDSTHGAIEPIWHSALGAPYVEGARARVPGPGGAHGESEIPIEYFRRPALEALARIVEASGIALGEVGADWRYRIAAAPGEEADCGASSPAAGATGDDDGFVVEDLAPPYEVTARRLAPLLAEASAYGPAAEEDARVLIPRGVLDETIVIAHRASEVETGGFLLGRLHRDLLSEDLFIQITAQIPAEHTECERTRMVFTPETWAAALDAVARRGSDEEICGWYHHHPNFCRDCPAERRATCPLNANFFSAEDVAVMRVCFPRGHQTGLLLGSDDDGGLRITLYGWRGGVVVERGFHVTPEESEPSEGDPNDA